jgi:hypothetical protein
MRYALARTSGVEVIALVLELLVTLYSDPRLLITTLVELSAPRHGNTSSEKHSTSAVAAAPEAVGIPV